MLRDEPTLRSDLLKLPEEPAGPLALIPAFRQATRMRGAFGWFTSGWISKLAPGLAVYLRRCDTEPMQFTVSPELFPAESAMMTSVFGLSDEEADERVRSVLLDEPPGADALARHALACMAWMLANDRLRIRVAVPLPWSNYHPKIWWFDDGTDQVVVLGSGNATSKGVHLGVEHMDVKVSWEEGAARGIRKSLSMVEDWANGRSEGLRSVHDLPDAIAAELIRTAPGDPPTYDDYLRAARFSGRPVWAVTPEMAEELRDEVLTAVSPRLRLPPGFELGAHPYEHQLAAVEAWEGCTTTQQDDAHERGVLAMATGAGKTITSLVCATRAQDRRPDSAMLLVVAVPSRPLVDQWCEEIAAFGIQPLLPGTPKRRAQEMTSLARRLQAGGTHVVLITHNRLVSLAFQGTLRNLVERSGALSMLIADEAHALGAEGSITRPPDFFELTLGLSATPERQHDSDGTEHLFRLLGPPVYEFGIGRAIGFCLVPYDYHVHAATLAGEELDEYIVLSRRIGALLRDEDADEEGLRSLLIRRRRVVENAEAKIRLFSEVLRVRGPRSIRHALVYASSKDPQQFEALRGVLNDHDVDFSEVTQKETGDRKRLRGTLEAFKEGHIQVLLAKKVLDEGVDIPSVREAFIVASSTVEREWVQRRGRVLRKKEGKSHAVLHDFLALPPRSCLRGEGAGSLGRAVRNELDRAIAFATHASNGDPQSGAWHQINRLREALLTDDSRAMLLEHPSETLIAADVPKGTI